MNNINFTAVKQMAAAIQSNPELKMRNWQAKVTWKDGVQNDVQIREFAPFRTDEPAPLGGTDVAPNPVEYLIAAAASCFTITFEVLASEQGIRLNDVEVEIEADLNAAVFLGLESGDGGILNPVIHLKADTSASPEAVEKIARTALEKSPVLASLKMEIGLQVH